MAKLDALLQGRYQIIEPLTRLDRHGREHQSLVHIPRSLHQRLAEAVMCDGVSVDIFVTTALPMQSARSNPPPLPPSPLSSAYPNTSLPKL